MRAAPAFQVTLRRFGVWRAAVWLTVASGWVAGLAWWHQADPSPATTGWGLAVAATTWRLGRSLTALVPTGLGWDGQVWRLAQHDRAPIEGRLAVALDLGAWMLLRFEPSSAVRRAPVRWVPAQRRGLELDWHALRSTVHAAPPGAARVPRASAGTGRAGLT